MNVIALFKFELVYFDVKVQHISHDSLWIPHFLKIVGSALMDATLKMFIY